jgi:hypothetical protein
LLLADAGDSAMPVLSIPIRPTTKANEKKGKKLIFFMKQSDG